MAENNVEEVQLSEVEQQAYDKGWRPKEEFQGPEDKWVTAETFMDRAPFFDKIDSMKRDFNSYKKQMENTVNSLVEHHRRFRETELAELEKRTQETINELKAQKIAALESNEAAAVVQIDDKISSLKEDLQVKKAAAQVEAATDTNQNQNTNAEFQAWVAENSWYNNDAELHDEADQFAIGYRVAHPEAGFSDIVQHVEKKIRKLYPEKFPANKARQNAPAVEGAGVSRQVRTKGDTITLSDLSPEERQILQVYKQRIPGYTDEKYLTELNKVKKHG